jgi:hypothetical protein
MSLGWLLAHRREETNRWTSSPTDILGFLVIAVLIQWFAMSATFDNALLSGLSIPLTALALALYATPLLFKSPGQLEATPVAKLLVGLGLVSFAALIVNESVRLVASFLRTHDTPDALWWLFLVVFYIPGATVLFAWPITRLFGLLPDQRKPAAGEPLPGAPALGGPPPDLNSANAAGN